MKNWWTNSSDHPIISLSNFSRNKYQQGELTASRWELRRKMVSGTWASEKQWKLRRKNSERFLGEKLARGRFGKRTPNVEILRGKENQPIPSFIEKSDYTRFSPCTWNSSIIIKQSKTRSILYDVTLLDVPFQNVINFWSTLRNHSITFN